MKYICTLISEHGYVYIISIPVAMSHLCNGSYLWPDMWKCYKHVSTHMSWLLNGSSIVFKEKTYQLLTHIYVPYKIEMYYMLGLMP